MNRELVINATLGLMLLDWSLFLVILFWFPDLPPPGFIQRVMINTLFVLTFPLILGILLLNHDPPYFYFTMGVLFLCSALIWAVALERLLHLFRRWMASPVSPAGSEEEFRKLLDEHRNRNS